ncbi:MAG: 4Fe-4S dicluster domain-containing protein [Candidatus Lokiarchaeota archaeon]|nr:4Fe-4S dicluster domain-containing protein [Candidatus Lokiarchaeota archaeon]
MIQINEEKCSGCSYCVLTCPVDALTSYYVVEVNEKCTECKICYYNCPNYAIILPHGGS